MSTSCFNVHCLSTRSYTDSTGVLRLLATRGDGEGQVGHKLIAAFKSRSISAPQALQ